jgi:hypothetical protein
MRMGTPHGLGWIDVSERVRPKTNVAANRCSAFHPVSASPAAMHKDLENNPFF